MNNARLFLSGEIDVLDLGGGIVLSRERTKRNVDLWHFSDGEKDVKQMWVKRSKEAMEKPCIRLLRSAQVSEGSAA